MKLNPWTIIIVGFCLGVSIFAFVFFNQAMPKLTAAKYQEEYKQKLQEEADKMPQAKKRKASAIKMVDDTTAIWERYVRERTPSTSVQSGGINLAVDPYQLSVDVLKFRNNMQLAIDQQVKKGGVKVLSMGQVKMPANIHTVGSSALLNDFFAFSTFGFPVVIADLGTVTVEGTYAQIQENVRSYRSMKNYLVVADGLRLDGTSPVLRGTYNLSVLGFIRGKKLFPAINEVAAAPATGAGAGFGGGRGPGGPPSFAGPGGRPGAPTGPSKGK